MTEVINKIFKNIETYPIETYKNMTVIGINATQSDMDMMSLETGLNMGLVEITELDESGSVGEVKVKNNAVVPLLLLDGEEILGSKQNRIVNSTIIIQANSEKIIPVSCVEEGRWDYKSDKFKYSDTMATGRVRERKQQSVTNSLRENNNFNSDQCGVWLDVNQIETELVLDNATGALHDSYQKKTFDINSYKDNFTVNNKQNGLIVFINGKLAGFELLYNSSAYKNYHDKIIKSYILDAIATQNMESMTIEYGVDELIEIIKNSKIEKFNSVGLGVDYRVESNEITGSALFYEDNLVNASFFKKNADYSTNKPRLINLINPLPNEL